MNNNMILMLAVIASLFMYGCQKENNDLAESKPLTQEEIEKFQFPAPFDWQAHRGGRGLYPENTIPAFLGMSKFPVRTLELDVVISKEGVPVVSHDPWISAEICLDTMGEKMENAQGEALRILDMPYSEIRQYDCGSRRPPSFPRQQTSTVQKPTLQAVLRSVTSYYPAQGKAIPAFNIEIKSRPEWDGTLTPPPSEFVRNVLGVIRGFTGNQRLDICIQSFDERALEAVKKQSPDIQTALLVKNNQSVQDNLSRLSFQPDTYSPRFDLLSAEDVEYLHSQEIEVIPWNVNQLPDMVRVINMGVDGLITDYPDIIPELRNLGQPNPAAR